jgi:hypothetical protein
MSTAHVLYEFHDLRTRPSAMSPPFLLLSLHSRLKSLAVPFHMFSVTVEFLKMLHFVYVKFIDDQYTPSRKLHIISDILTYVTYLSQFSVILRCLSSSVVSVLVFRFGGLCCLLLQCRRVSQSRPLFPIVSLIALVFLPILVLSLARWTYSSTLKRETAGSYGTLILSQFYIVTIDGFCAGNRIYCTLRYSARPHFTFRYHTHISINSHVFTVVA